MAIKNNSQVISHILIDLNFLLIWFGIYSSTKVLLLLNTIIKNSESLDLEIDQRDK